MLRQPKLAVHAPPTALGHAEVPPTPFERTKAPTDVDDRELVSRLVAAYQASTLISPKPSQSIWEGIGEKKGDVHEALTAGKLKRCNAFFATRERLTYSTGSTT